MPTPGRASLDYRNRPVDSSRFAMIPRPDVPRSVFTSTWSHKTTFNAGLLVPVYVDEVLPGDSFELRATMFARLSTPLFPMMDDLYLDTFYFFVPNRLVWTNWRRFMGEQLAPGDSISYLVPQVVSTGSGFAQFGLGDYFGLPVVGQQATTSVSVSALPFRAYNLIYNEWFRDQNLIGWVGDFPPAAYDDGPDAESAFVLRSRAKSHDYFTSALPWPEKGGTPATIAITGSAPVVGLARLTSGGFNNAPGTGVYETGGSTTYDNWMAANNPVGQTGPVMEIDPVTSRPMVYADLSAAASVTINALRQAAQIQALLERDARGGTRYTEIVRSHFGVVSPDARLQRPEYLGGSSQRMGVSAVPQTSATGLTGGASPLGQLGAAATFVGENGFRQSFTEHGHIIGLANVRGVQAYQQGVRRMFDRRTRYDFYWPAFAHLGEQPVYRRELYATGAPANDEVVFGYQERWAEYRYRPSTISGLFRSGVSGSLDAWHFSQYYGAAPVLNYAFVQENLPMARVLAAGALADHQQVLFDSVFSLRATRPIPAFSVPELGGRF